VEIADECPPSDTRLLLALLLLLRHHTRRGERLILSCRRELYGGLPIYWVQPTERSRAKVATALAAFLRKHMAVSRTSWPLTQSDAQRIIQLAGDQLPQLRLHHRLERKVHIAKHVRRRSRPRRDTGPGEV
jgi:hypothetical protein